MPVSTSLPLVVALGILVAVACGGGKNPLETATPTLPVTITTPTPTAAVTSSPRPSPTQTRSPQSLEWLQSTVNVPALPSPFADPALDADLQNVIETALPDFGGEYSVVVHNLLDGRYAAFNESNVYYGASLFKSSLMYEAFIQRDAGNLDFAMEVVLEEKYVVYDLGTLEFLGLEEGDIITVEGAIRAMTIASDTPTAVLMQDLVGVAADQTLLKLGIEDTQFLNRALPATADGMARLFAAIASGEGVSDSSRLEMLSLMRQEHFSGGVIAGAPAGTAIAHKTGSFANAGHDVAIVWGPAGPYIIAVLTDASYTLDPVRDVAVAVWAYFEANP
ncbi:MAG: serine hydrolase [Chloroflexi bacterium]|nr:serine hydrolase [Chloroflexota bacterium]